MRPVGRQEERLTMPVYRRLMDSPLPWRLRHAFEGWTEGACRAAHPGLYRWLHLGSARDRVRPITQGPQHHFFGYYDKSPWNASGRLVLAHQVDFNDRAPVANDAARIGVVNLVQGNVFQPLSVARCWNWQQGALPQWHPAEPERRFFHNDRRDGAFVGVLQDVDQGEVRVYERPIYAVAPDGRTAFSLNFARLQTHRPGYGYAGVEDPNADRLAPEGDGIARVDLDTGRAECLVSLAELAACDPLDSMSGAVHYVNHIQVSPGARHLAFFHIWRTGEKSWRVRLYSMALDGSARVRMLDTGAISHYDWLDDERLLVWAEHPNGGRHFLLCDRRDGSAKPIGADRLTEDGHCTFSPDRRWVLNDTYPDVHDMRTLMLYRWPDGPRLDLARLYSPKARWWGELRCDLHPRWRRDGRAVCVDSVHQGSRQMYVVDVEDLLQ